MNSITIGRMTARRLLEQFGLLTLPHKEKKRSQRPAKPAVDKAAEMQPSATGTVFRRHI